MIVMNTASWVVVGVVFASAIGWLVWDFVNTVHEYIDDKEDE